MGKKEFQFSSEDLILVKKYIETYPNQTLHIPGLRAALTKLRINRLESKDIKTFTRSSDKDIVENTIKHNLIALKQAAALARPDILISPITSTNSFRINGQKMKVLTIGPRTEAEIFSLLAAGFAPSNITGLDLITYSPFIELGDLHAMPYGSNSFDVIILGWVLGYSQNIKKAVLEIIRVAKPGTFVAIGHENDPRPREALDQQRGFSLEGTDLSTSQEILDLFGSSVDKVIFRDDVAPELANQVCHVIAVFRLK